MARYIDADTIIQKLKDAVERVKPNEVTKDIVNDVIKLLQNEPTADVQEVKRGHWREGAFLKVSGLNNYPSVICSNCGITFCDIINNHDYMYRYCPNCGADMRGDAE